VAGDGDEGVGVLVGIGEVVRDRGAERRDESWIDLAPEGLDSLCCLAQQGARPARVDRRCLECCCESSTVV
jgi:hypothetical protein